MLRILYLCPRALWERRVSASRRHDVEAIARHPEVEFRQSGQGWPDWEDSAAALANVRRIMPGCDCVWWYKPDGTRVSGTTIPVTPGFRKLADHCLVAEKFQEAHWGSPGSVPSVTPAWEQAVDRHVGLAILSHENDLPRMEKAEAVGIVVKHIPHSAEVTVFGGVCKPWEQRDIDVVLTGTIGAEHYPLRARWLELLDQIRRIDPALRIVHHPRPPHLAANLERAGQYVQEYADILGRSKFVLGCPSKWGYWLARFSEAAATGAVHISSMPDDAAFRVSLGKHIREVDAGTSDAELIQVVAEAVNDQNMGQRMSEDGHRLWREHFTQENFADRFIKAVRECL